MIDEDIILNNKDFVTPAATSQPAKKGLPVNTIPTSPPPN